MKTRLITGLFLSISIGLFAGNNQPAEPMAKVINNALTKAEQQSLSLAKSLENQKGRLPRTFQNNKFQSSDSKWWCSGFFPGTLWYLYENNKSPELLNYARQYTSRVENEQYTTDNHDVGFILFCSYGNGLRLTKDQSYPAILMNGAKSLSTRYSSKIGAIKSWDSNPKKWQYPVIIDNMMNLELMLWAAQYSGDKKYRDIAIEHADKTLKHHFRADNSCYHVVSYDTTTCLPHIKQTHQGCADESAWSRGQAWGLYGYSMMYRITKEKRYLNQAVKIANYLTSHPDMPKDCIPYWDFNAPNIPNEPRDASAGAIIASAMCELSKSVDKKSASKYLKVAETAIRTLASPAYTAQLGENGNFILMHSVGSIPHKAEVDAPLTYADYYYVEALLRYKEILTDKKI